MQVFNFLVDEKIPQVKEWVETIYSGQAALHTFRGEDENPSTEQLKVADCLVVRSVTEVNQNLLAGSNIKAVMTATSGVDHIDLEYLKESGIDFYSALGSNSIAVKDYTLWVILKYLNQTKLSLKQMKVGVIGCGQVGSKVVRSLKKLGITVLVYDPPLREQQSLLEKSSDNTFSLENFSEKEELLEADILTFHVPFVRAKENPHYPTEGMFDEEWLDGLSKKIRPTLVINTARSEVIAPVIYQKWKKGDLVNQVIFSFDVWPDEPNPPTWMVEKSFLATPHIAGHSAAAKKRASEMLFKQWLKKQKLEKVSQVEVSQLEKNLSKKLSKNPTNIVKQIPFRINLENKLPKNPTTVEMLYHAILLEFESLEEASRKLKVDPNSFIEIRHQYGKRLELREIELVSDKEVDKYENLLHIKTMAQALGFKVI